MTAKPIELSLSPAARAAILAESKRKSPLETGGVLVGKWEEGKLFIEHIVGPGPKAVHGQTSFLRDGQYAQQEIDRLFEASSGELDYVGEWHSHPKPCGPSGTDVKSMAEISADPKYNTDYPALILCIRSGKRQWHLVGFVYRIMSFEQMHITCTARTGSERPPRD